MSLGEREKREIRERMDDAQRVFADMIKEVHEVNVGNGWFDDNRGFEADIALLHEEVTEMFSAWRDFGFDDMTPSYESEHLHKPEGVGSEAADVLIRLLDTVYRHDIDIVAEFRRKLAYNRTRGYRHGGKRL